MPETLAEQALSKRGVARAKTQLLWDYLSLFTSLGTSRTVQLDAVRNADISRFRYPWREVTCRGEARAP